MSKYLFVGDIHTKHYIIDAVEKLDKKRNFSKIIFLGDYVDDWNSDANDSLMCLNKLVNYKLQNIDKVKLLLGNHEFSYMGFPCSGHKINSQIPEFLNNHIKNFDIIYALPNIIATHAGLTDTWYSYFKDIYNCDDIQKISLICNNLVKKQDYNFFQLLNMASYTSGGKDKTASIIWARPNDLINNSQTNLIQIVGHTPSNDIINKNINNRIYFIDSFSTDRNRKNIGKEEFLIYDDLSNEFSTINIKEV